MREHIAEETELKLEMDGPVDQVRRQLAIAYGSPVGQRRLVSTYFDTPDRRLWTAGVTLRVRKEGARCIQTIKFESAAAAGLFTRPELESEVSGDLPELDPPTRALIAELAGASSCDLPLEVQFTTDVDRRMWRVDRAGAQLELVSDFGAIRAHGRSVPIHEIEIELKAGPLRSLFDLAAGIGAMSPLRIGVQSKAERGYTLDEQRRGEAVKAERTALTGDVPVQAAFQAICHACIRHYRLNETRLLAEPEAETLHQCRVALRRLRTALDLFKPLLSDPESRALAGRVKRAARMFGDGRNIDVLIGLSNDADLIAKLNPHRKQIYDVLVADLRSPTLRELMLDLTAWTSAGFWLSDAATAALRREAILPFAVRRLRRSRRRLKRRGAHLAHLDASGRHAVRIAAKNLRYTAEFLGGLFPGPVASGRLEAFVEAVERLQTDLGRLTDHATGSALLKRFGIRGATHDGRTAPHKRRSIKSAARACKDVVDLKPFWAGAHPVD
ncbi:MAG: CHAD domain-containing protein [Brevundimonas sp.]|uniref:CYTH and CHAD domain-containing protein n=1 Tax=Brevundimonas sp. TaxID=1871086 RepID=UPI00248A26A3|nr:CYTH and CHAD domain-containing protein [Brevundimonas sp.]MDI1325398.1 CHAD domain-containing protein [Brevundimonas sp.]